MRTVLTSLFVAAAVAAVVWVIRESGRRRRHPVAEGHQPDIEIPYEEPFELYHNALSLCSMKSRVCMAELGVPYKSHHIDLIETGAYENIRPHFLAVNPGGTVPVLVHEGHPIYESHEQIRYAALHAPPGSPSLVPDDPESRARMEEWIDRSSLTDDPMNHGDESAGNAVPALTVPLFAGMIDRIAWWKIAEGLLFHFDKFRPVLFLLLKGFDLRRVDRLPPIIKAVARGRRQMGAHLDALEEQLIRGGGPWILGETFTLADVSWLVIFERLEQTDSLHVFTDPEVDPPLRPACAAYWSALKARPSYQQAILDHSHPTITHGTRRIREAKAGDPQLREALEGA